MKIIKENNNYLEKEEVLGGDLIPYYKDINDLEALFSYIPEGIILPYIPHDKTMSIIDINAFLYDYDFVICDGSEFFNVDSSVFNVAGRFLPKLNDEYFLMGAFSGGVVSGNNFLQPHRHSLSFDIILGTYSNTTNINHSHGTGFTIDMSNTSVEHNHYHNAGYSSYHDTVSTGFCIYDGNDYCRDYNGSSYKGYTIGQHKKHRHTITLSINNVSGYSSSDLRYYTYRGYTKIDHTHNYECLGTIGSGTSITLTDNRPKYIKTYFIIKFK